MVKEKKNNLKISVVVPTRNRAGILSQLLESLAVQSFKNFEVLIVDGGSTDGTRRLVKLYKKRLKIKFISGEPGLTKLSNSGLKHAKGDIYLRTDDDVEAPKDWLKAIAKTFEEDNVGGVTGPTVTPDKSTRDLFVFQDRFKKGNWFWRRLGDFYYSFIMEGKYEEIGKFTKSGVYTTGSNLPMAMDLKSSIEVEAHESCVLAIRTKLLKRLQGFDESFDMGSDFNEADLAFRLRKLGYKIIFNPKAFVYHRTGQTEAFMDTANAYARMKNYIIFYFRHIKPDSLSKLFHFMVYVLFQNAYYSYLFWQKKDVRYLGGWLAAFMYLPVKFLKWK